MKHKSMLTILLVCGAALLGTACTGNPSDGERLGDGDGEVERPGRDYPWTDGSFGPTDPTDPADPADPVDPFDPVDPGDPVVALPELPFGLDDPIFDGLATCESNSQCQSDEACTQGGHCVNITGERDATAALQADMIKLAMTPVVGVGAPYALPPNGIYQINDLRGDGLGLRIFSPVLLDAAGSLFEVKNGIVGLRVEPTGARAQVRDLRIDPRNPSGTNDTIGIDIRAPEVRLDNIFLWRLGTGVRAHSELDGVALNLDKQQWSRLVFRNVHHHAIHLVGEVNHGLFEGLEVIGAAGISDHSLRGNTYLAPTMEGTHTRSMNFTSEESNHLVLGSYVEGGDPLPETGSDLDLHVGGNAIGRLVGPTEAIGLQAGRLTFLEEESGLKVRVPGDENSAFAFKHPQEGQWWYLKYFPTVSEWGFSLEGSTTAPFFWTGGENPNGAGALYLD